MRVLVIVLCVSGAVSLAADVNASGPDGSTALLLAAHRNDLAQVALLLRAGARADTENIYGVTALAEAAANGNAAMIERLIGAGADPNKASPQGESPLMAAAQSGSVDALRALLKHGAAVDAREGWKNQTALMWAAAANHAAIVQTLIEYGADVNARSTAWPAETHKYPKNGNLVSDRPKGALTPLLFAAREGALDAARVLVQAKADLNLTEPDGTNALTIATINAHYDLAAMLLDAGADPNIADVHGRTVLYAAADMNSLEPSITRPAPKENDALTALDIVRLALKHGAKPNVRLIGPTPGRGLSDNPDPILRAGTTPFIRAAKTGDIAVMQALVENGADPTLNLDDRTTALMAAAGLGWRWGESQIPESGAIEAVKFCLAHGADPQAVNDQGETALHGAAARGSNALIELLVEHGASLQAKDKRGRTPLAVAIGDENRGNPGYPAAAAFLKKLMAQGEATGR